MKLTSSTQIGDFFERTYVVNLPYRHDRRRAMVRELKKVEMPLKPHKVEIFPAIRPENAGEFPSIGALGCFLSHLAILKKAQQDKLSNVLIIEDDLTLSSQFKTNQETLIHQLNQTDWGFVYFGHIEKTEPTPNVTVQPCLKPIATTHFYGVNGIILDRLLAFLDILQRRPPGHPLGGPMHLDGAYSTFRAQNPDVLTLIAAPNLGWQRSSRSDIASNQWFDQIPVFKQIVGGLRTLKH